MDKSATLECPHCGDVAIESPDGLFTDGDGGNCISCGYPGHVSVDDAEENARAYWSTRDLPWDICNSLDCIACQKNEEKSLSQRPEM